jgi:glutamine amidotransferase
MITIIDYGMGNLGSIANMIKKVGGKSVITSNKDEIKKAKKLLLPGVGAFDNAVKNLKNLDLWDLIKEKVLVDRVPIMGICLGMQLLTKGSEEGKLEGFGFIDAYTKKFTFENNKLKIPHMGWNIVKLQKTSKLFQGMENQENRFYFVHSYAVECYEEKDILTTTFYGYEFVSSFEKENIIGCQFHPEKSHKFGMALFKNFVERY